jgi:hypothetical protein
MRLGLGRLGILLGLAALAAACGGGDESQPATSPQPPVGHGNLFANPSFEQGREPWVSLSTEPWGSPFSLSSETAHTGTHSAFLEMRATADAGTRVWGVVQEMSPEEFPELISGYYRVGQWTRGTSVQYLQFVVVVFGATNMPPPFPNYQIRYPLAGIDAPPYGMLNAEFILVGTQEPVSDDWVYFERNVRQDFLKEWGVVPEGFSKIRTLFVVRYEDKEEGVTTPTADVFYDDLYLGPATANPNAPNR